MVYFLIHKAKLKLVYSILANTATSANIFGVLISNSMKSKASLYF